MEEETIDLMELFEEIKKKWQLVAKIVMVCILVASTYLIFIPKTYESESLIRVRLPGGAGGESNTVTEERVITNYVEMLKSPDLLGLEKEEYEKIVQISTPKKSEIIKIVVSAKTAEEAQEKNIKIFKNFKNRLVEKETQRIEKTIEITKEQLKVAEQKWQARKAEGQLPFGTKSAEEEIYLAKMNSMYGLQMSKQFIVENLEVVATPSLPTKPAKPKKALTLIIATLVGVMAGVGYIIAKYCVKNRKTAFY